MLFSIGLARCGDRETTSTSFPSTLLFWPVSLDDLSSSHQILVAATMDVYKAAVSNFLPTPSKSHYVFNLRDFSRVVGGVLLVPKTHMQEGDKLIRLWVHEVYRVFYDRLVDDADRYKNNTELSVL